MRALQSTVLVGATVLAVVAGGAGVATARSAAAPSCAPIYYSPSGHKVNTTCYSGPGKGYAIQATACTSGGCRTITSSFVRYPDGNSLDAGSAYISSGSATIVTTG